MKTKELIDRLISLDPSGEEDVCINNMDIVDISRFPAYYDGVCEILTREEGRIVGAKYKREGIKIQITTECISDILWDRYDLLDHIDYSALYEYGAKATREYHQKIVKEAMEMDKCNEQTTN